MLKNFRQHELQDIPEMRLGAVSIGVCCMHDTRHLYHDNTKREFVIHTLTRTSFNKKIIIIKTKQHNHIHVGVLNQACIGNNTHTCSLTSTCYITNYTVT